MIHTQSPLRRFLAGAQILFFALFVAMALPLHAQLAGTGSIQGTITDSTGALLPNAKVLLTNSDTQVRREAVSDSSGVYSFANIDVGTYSVSVTAPGFETYTRTKIVLEVGSSISVNVGMIIGATETKVEVQSEGLSLQTEDPSFKQTIDETTITEMPLNGRQMTALIGLSGGSSPAPGGDFTGSKYSYAAISVSIAGGNGNTTQWRLDGGDNNDYMANANLPFPFPDAVNQFSVESTALGARAGSHSGGLVNVVTRSGTNTYHGSAFDFFRNNYINATNFYSVTKDTLHQNQVGGTFGGKILRDKLFAFAGYQFSRTKSGQASVQAHVPTTANLKGDFSVTDPTQKLFNPVTGAALTGTNQIDPTLFNAQALALAKYLPQATDGTGIVSYSIPLWVFDKQFVTRVDYTINPKNDLYARYFLDGYQAPAFFDPTNILTTTQPGNVERVQTFVIGEDYTFSSKTVNTFHVSMARRVDVRGPAPGITACTLGVQLNCPLPLSSGFQITVGSTSTHGFSAYCGTCAPGHFNDNTLAVNNDLTLVRGKHEMVVGAELARNQLNIVGGFQANGNFGFNGQYSANGPGGGATIGDANLDFLMGAMSSYSQSKTQQNALRGWVPSIYFQDTYHPTTKLTVVAGIRWQPEFIPVDFFNRGSIFDYNAFLANKVSTVYPGAPAGSFFYGDPGVSRQFTKNSPWQFSPNLGVSYDPTGSGKTVIRAGAGIAYDEVNFFTGQRVNQNPPFATSSSPNTSGQLSFTSPWTVGGVLNNPYSQPQPPVPSAANAIFPVQGQFIVFPTHFHPSYTIQYTASIQHQFGKGWQLQLDYIGNGTRHAPVGSPLNDAVFVPGVWGANGTGCDPIVKTGPAAVKAGAAGTACSTTGNTKSRYALTIANPLQGNQYQGGGGGSVMVGDYATANYNGLVTTVQHRLSSTFSMLANWTWSKCLNIADGNGDITGSPVSNASNIAQDYGPCGSDYRHIENVVIVAKSEFSVSGWKAFALNGWELAPLFHIQSGAPLNVTQGSDLSLTSNGNDRPNLVPGVPIYVPFGHRAGASGLPASVVEANRGYLNQAAFTLNTVGGTYGNISRNAFRGIPSLQFDAQISRIFPIRERLNMDLRLEAFNVLNHPNFNNPSSSNPASTNLTFGQISSAGAARIFQVGAKFSF
jgi:Carboxypeptidase regulatory-like domain